MSSSLKDFNKICGICDDFLFLRAESLITLAIPSLHVIRAHPMYLEKYKTFYKSEFIPNFYKFLRNIAANFRSLIRAIFSFSPPLAFSKPVNSKLDFIFVSHLINIDHLKNESDFYHHDLPNQLSEQGFNVAIALINYTNVSAEKLAKMSCDLKIPRIILGKNLNFHAEWMLRKKIFFEIGQLLALCKNPKWPINFIRLTIIELLGGGTLHALRLGLQIERLVQKYCPRTLVTTYEGHSWERVAFGSARKINSKITCVGYMHAGILAGQHASLRNLTKKYNPDIVLTCGKSATDYLIKNKVLGDVTVICIGSSRCSLSQEDMMRSGSVNSCLVIPEGTQDECKLLFEFSLELAHKAPHIDFIWRLHPNMIGSRLTKISSKLKTIPKNIRISNNDFDADISRSMWVLYRGSTAVIKAVGQGLIPIYLAVKDEIPINILGLGGFNSPSVKSVDDFDFILKHSAEMSGSSLMVKLKAYADDFYTEFSPDIFISFYKNSYSE